MHAPELTRAVQYVKCNPINIHTFINVCVCITIYITIQACMDGTFCWSSPWKASYQRDLSLLSSKFSGSESLWKLRHTKTVLRFVCRLRAHTLPSIISFINVISIDLDVLSHAYHHHPTRVFQKHSEILVRSRWSIPQLLLFVLISRTLASL